MPKPSAVVNVTLPVFFEFDVTERWSDGSEHDRVFVHLGDRRPLHTTKRHPSKAKALRAGKAWARSWARARRERARNLMEA